MTQKRTPSYNRILLSRWGMGRIAHLPVFLPEVNRICRPYSGLNVHDRVMRGRIDAVAGWGFKRTAKQARMIAQKRNLPYIAVEDGFLRSYDLGVNGAQPLSLVVDHTGIYYDSTQSCDLETMIENGIFDDALLERARIAMDWMRHERLSKYNKDLIEYDGAPIKRLIIDQTEGDASVLLSGAAPHSFEKMIEDALHLYAPEDIAIKLHPDTMTGKKGGYLRDLAHQYGVRLLSAPYNPWSLLAQTREVATISSLFGFEALMAGKEVYCYGLPFYAGWGVTHDQITTERRTKKRSVTEIFATAYLCYARYVNPFTGNAATLEDVIAILSDRVRHEKRVADLHGIKAIGFSVWKRLFIPKFTGGAVSFRYRMPKNRQNGEAVLLWGLKRENMTAPVVRIEDGFVRSRGLGAKLVRPWSLVIDKQGLYFDPRTPSDLEGILQNTDMPKGLLHRAAMLRDVMVERAVSKYNTGDSAAVSIPRNGRRIILVPGQVEDDASIRSGTVAGLNTNLELLKAARAAAPDAYILYKPHPDIEAAKRKGAIPADVARRYCDDIASGLNISALWPHVDEVHTLTSLSGFEGLLRGKKVYTYGRPFYAGWGLTQDMQAFPRRNKVLTIEGLIAGALILYPAYFDWKTGEICNIETVIHRLSQQTV